ncbi:MAG: hypothetical protein HKO03_06145 [Acidimicrobiia bacterium]|nr:hypothetical protein [Acidimicrobiia bacterium]
MATLTTERPPHDNKPNRPIGIWLAVATVLLAVILGMSAYLAGRQGDEPAPGVTTTAQTATSSTLPEVIPPTTVPVTTPAQVVVYFLADHIQDSNRPGPHLMPVLRDVEISVPVDEVGQVRAAVLAVIEGPTAEDSQWTPSLSTSIPSGTELQNVSVDRTGDTGQVTLDFNAAFASGGGTFSVTSRLAQIVYTATGFEGIDEVLFLIDGETVDVFSSEGLILSGPQARADYTDVLALVMIESPLAGHEVKSPVTVSGMANAFEATVNLRLEDAGGNLLTETFTTATCGTGCFGEFSADLSFSVEQPTPARIIGLEYSAKDGTPVNVFSVPVTLLSGGTAAPVEPEALSFEVDVAGLVAEPLDGTTVVSAGYGLGPDEIGFLEETSSGPCCFDVSGEGDIVVLDAANHRVIRFAPGGEAVILMKFDAASIVPDAIAVIGDKVIVMGQTPRPDRPYDAIAMSLETGELLKRVESVVEGPGDLRATTDGVFWASPSSNLSDFFSGMGQFGASRAWVGIADSAGELLEPVQQRTFDVLPGESSMTMSYDAGVEVTVQPAGDSRPTTYDVLVDLDDAAFMDILGYQRFSDGALVISGPAGTDSRTRFVAVAMGTDNDDNLVTRAFTFDVERWSTVTGFNTYRYGFGALYALHTTSDGVQVVRYDIDV